MPPAPLNAWKADPQEAAAHGRDPATLGKSCLHAVRVRQAHFQIVVAQSLLRYGLESGAPGLRNARVGPGYFSSSVMTSGIVRVRGIPRS